MRQPRVSSRRGGTLARSWERYRAGVRRRAAAMLRLLSRERRMEDLQANRTASEEYLQETYYQRLFSLSREPGREYPPVAGRALLVSSTLGPGGAERQLTNTAIGLKARDVDARYLGLWLDAADGNDFYLGALQSAGIPARALVRTEMQALTRPGVLPRDLANQFGRLPPYHGDIVASVYQALMTSRPEAVHSWLDETNIQVGIACLLAGVPRIVLSCRSLSPDHFAFYQPYFRPAYRALAAEERVSLLNNSDAGATSYAAWLGIDRSKIKVIRNGLHEATADGPEQRVSRASLGIPADAPLIGSVFRIGEEKRPFLWLDIARKVSEVFPGAHFLLVGDGPLKEEVRKRAAEIGLGNRLHMSGVVRGVESVIRSLDVLLLVSRVEGLPNVLIEAQSLGVPVVSSDVGGAAETFVDHVTGYLVQGQDSDTYAGRVVAILENEGWRRKASSAARSFARERFDLGRMVEETLEQYRLGDRSRGPDQSPEA